MTEDNGHLGQRLVKSGIVTADQLDEALEFQASIGGRLGVILIKLGLIEPTQLAEVFSIMCEVPLVKADEMFIDHKLIKSFERKLMETRSFVPVSETNASIKIATSDPSDVELLNIVEFETEKSVELCAINIEDINRILNLVYTEQAPPQLKVPTPVKAPVTCKTKARSLLRNSSFRDVVLALIDDLQSKGIIEYTEILDRIDKLQSDG